MHMSIGGCTRAWSLCVCTCTGSVVLVNNSSCTQTMHTIAALENAHLKGACACTCTTGWLAASGGALAVRGHQVREVAGGGCGHGKLRHPVPRRAQAVHDHPQVPAPHLRGGGGGVLGEGGEHERDHLHVGRLEVRAEAAGCLRS